jgi:hypothetical protein
MAHRLLLCCILGGLMAGCATTPAKPPAGPQFDAVYQGDDRLVSGFGFICDPADTPRTLTIQGGRFDYPFLVNAPRTAPLPVQIAEDGTFWGAMQYGVVTTMRFGSNYKTEWVTVSGRISGPDLQGTVSNEECTRQLTMQRH